MRVCLLGLVFVSLFVDSYFTIYYNRLYSELF